MASVWQIVSANRLRKSLGALAVILVVLRALWLKRRPKDDAQRPRGRGDASAHANRQLRDNGRRQPQQAARQPMSLGPGRERGGKGSGRDGKPELWLAVEQGNMNYALQLLEAGHSVNAAHNRWTPLMKAAEEGHTEIMSALIQRRANLEATNKSGRTALSFAAAPSMGRQTCAFGVRLLLEVGANVEHRDERRETARQRALRDKQRAAVDEIDRFVKAARSGGDDRSQSSRSMQPEAGVPAVPSALLGSGEESAAGDRRQDRDSSCTEVRHGHEVSSVTAALNEAAQGCQHGEQ